MCSTHIINHCMSDLTYWAHLGCLSDLLFSCRKYSNIHQNDFKIIKSHYFNAIMYWEHTYHVTLCQKFIQCSKYMISNNFILFLTDFHEVWKELQLSDNFPGNVSTSMGLYGSSRIRNIWKTSNITFSIQTTIETSLVGLWVW